MRRRELWASLQELTCVLEVAHFPMSNVVTGQKTKIIRTVWNYDYDDDDNDKIDQDLIGEL